jgi:hypothetical protein
MSLYRWTVSGGLFLGVLTTGLVGAAFLLPGALNPRLSFAVGVFGSLTGIGLSMTALLLHPSNPDPVNSLEHGAPVFLALGLNCWPWLPHLMIPWFLAAGPP